MQSNGIPRWKKKFRVFVHVSFAVTALVFILTPTNFNTPSYLTPRLGFTLFLPNTGLQKSTRHIAQPGGRFSDAEVRKDTFSCSGVKEHVNYNNECQYIKDHRECNSGSFIDYLSFFYCTCQSIPAVGYLVLSLWLLALLYTLANTASDYFCPSLSTLSNLLKLPPTVAGVTLLPFGNGAPDLFSNIAAFVTSKSGDLGLNSVLGGGIFVTCVVVGCISLIVSKKGVAIDHGCFIRDVCFYLVALIALSLILVTGRVSLLGALAFMSIYVIYAIAVAWKELVKKSKHLAKFWTKSLEQNHDHSHIICLDVPLLEPIGNDTNELPDYKLSSDGSQEDIDDGRCSFWRVLLNILEMPLFLPRRLTIPVVEEARWSKGFAVSSVVLSPLLLCFLFISGESNSSISGKYGAYLVALIVGCSLGALVFSTTKVEHPPQKYLLPWVAGSFLMSMVWFYMIANELVALLLAFGSVLGVAPSIIGLTVLAWGNSLGDLIANSALALNGEDGIQIALSGCYAGPMFNALVGLGSSLLMRVWIDNSSLVIQKDDSLLYTMGFLMASLVWALVVLPNNSMRPSKLLGIGLLALYCVFLSLSYYKIQRWSHACKQLRFPCALEIVSCSKRVVEAGSPSHVSRHLAAVTKIPLCSGNC